MKFGPLSLLYVPVKILSCSAQWSIFADSCLRSTKCLHTNRAYYPPRWRQAPSIAKSWLVYPYHLIRMRKELRVQNLVHAALGHFPEILELVWHQKYHPEMHMKVLLSSCSNRFGETSKGTAGSYQVVV